MPAKLSADQTLVLVFLWSITCFSVVGKLSSFTYWLVNKELISQLAGQKRIGWDFGFQWGGGPKETRERRDQKGVRPWEEPRSIYHEVMMKGQSWGQTWTRVSQGKIRWQVMEHFPGYLQPSLVRMALNLPNLGLQLVNENTSLRTWITGVPLISGL